MTVFPVSVVRLAAKDISIKPTAFYFMAFSLARRARSAFSKLGSQAPGVLLMAHDDTKHSRPYVQY